MLIFGYKNKDFSNQYVNILIEFNICKPRPRSIRNAIFRNLIKFE